jgi:hypothetical protein
MPCTPVAWHGKFNELMTFAVHGLAADRLVADEAVESSRRVVSSASCPPQPAASGLASPPPVVPCGGRRCGVVARGRDGRGVTGLSVRATAAAAAAAGRGGGRGGGDGCAAAAAAAGPA